jgi:ribonuclease BN (tRNA processing enzyme)
MAVKLTVVGCSPAWPNPGSAHSGYLLEGPGRLLLDCGPGVLARLREHEGWPRVDAIVITHWHLDHWGDLVPWVWGRSFGADPAPGPPELWVPRGGRDELEQLAARFGTPGMFREAFDLREYEPSTTFAAAGFDVTPSPVEHYGFPTNALHVVDGSSSLAYSADTGPCAALARLARDADLFLCEATLERGDLDGDLRGHLSADEAAAAHEEAGAKALLLTHRPNELPVPASLTRARDGLELTF